MKGLVLKYKVEPKMKKGACMLNIQDPFSAKSTATVILQVLKEKKYKTQDVAQPRRNPNPNPPEHPLIPDDNPRAAANLSPRKMAFPEISLEEYERRLKKAFRSNPETTDGLIAALGLGCSSIIEELNYIACGFYMTDLTDKGWYDGMPVQYYWEDLVRCIPCIAWVLEKSFLYIRRTNTKGEIFFTNCTRLVQPKAALSTKGEFSCSYKNGHNNSPIRLFTTKYKDIRKCYWEVQEPGSMAH